MARSGIAIFEDDEEADLATFMLDACGLRFTDFMLNESIFTRENFEKNYDALFKMAENREFSRASYFIIGFLILSTGARISEKFRQGILEAARWEHEEGRWLDEEFAIKRRRYLEDFQEKIHIYKPGMRLHPAYFCFSGRHLIDSKVVVGINEFRNYCKYGKIHKIKYMNLDGWGLESIPSEVFEFKNLKSLCLGFNQITEIPDDISRLASLKHFFVASNMLTSLPESIGEISSFQSLNIVDNNHISSLPESITNLKDLKHIYVRGTKITQLPKFLKNARLDEFNKTIYL